MEPSPPTSPAATAKRRSFMSRLVSTVGLWAVMLLAVWWQNQTLLLGIAFVAGMLGVLEYFRLFSHEKPDRAYALLGIAIGLGWWAYTFFWTSLSAAPARMIFNSPLGWHDLAALVIALQGSFLLAYRGGLEGTVTLHRIFSTVFGVFYTIVCFGFLLRLLFFPCPAAGLDASPTPGNGLVIYLIATTKFTDMGAYAIGSLFGRHKMIPQISPAKSWEGLAGALLGTSAATALMWLLVPQYLAPLTLTHSLILIPVICFTAVTGDLAESIIKRCVSIKDSGHKLPGIGGVLDLTDSLLFTAPVFYLYLTLL